MNKISIWFFDVFCQVEPSFVFSASGESEPLTAGLRARGCDASAVCRRGGRRQDLLVKDEGHG